MSAAILALVLTGGLSQGAPPVCAGRPWQVLREERKHAYQNEEFYRALELVECEAAALRRLSADERRSGGDTGVPVSHCEALEVGYHICEHKIEDTACAAGYLDRQRTEGCCNDLQRASVCHRLSANAALLRHDLATAFAELEAAEVAAFRALEAASELPEEADAWLDLAGSAAIRVNVAAQLDDFDIVLTDVADVEEFAAFAHAGGDESSAFAAHNINLAAWGLLLAGEAGLSGARDRIAQTTALLQEALYELEPDSPRGTVDNIRINLALAALHAGDPVDARRWLDLVAIDGLAREEALWFHVLWIRAALACGIPVGVERSQRALDNLAAEGHTPMARWFAAWTEGRTHEAAGDRSGALLSYETAEAEFEAAARTRSPTQRLFLGGRGQRLFGDSTRRLLGLLLDTGEVEEAARVARHARNRELRMSTPVVCDDGQVVPTTGEVRLLYFRVATTALGGEGSGGRWVGFVITVDGVRARTIDLPKSGGAHDPTSDAELERWSDALLRPFSHELAGASLVSILATESLHDIPIHILPWGDGALIDAMSVVYSLDIAGCEHAEVGRSGEAAVIWGDEAPFQSEANGVADRLRSRGVSIDMHSPSTPKELATLSAAGSGIMHFVAHGIPGGAALASDTSLVFRNGVELSSTDILRGPLAPAFVFLSACRASSRDAETLGGRTSLAHAFLLRGARYVIAPVGEINGEVAAAVAARFYEAWNPWELEGAPRAFRKAFQLQRARVRSTLRGHLAMFRLYSR